ncbi:MAG: nuclear transport factor 2 family protein [Leptolyngbya sp. SIO1D8]|nr:nuclear transport factor 2 family protein [Leptolyngbya sp. SIO1D8]
MVDSQYISDLGQSYFQALSFNDPGTFDVEKWIRLTDENVLSNDPWGSPAKNGHQDLRDWATGLITGFGSIDFSVNSSFVASDRVAVYWTSMAKDRDGNPFEFSGIDVLEVNDEGTVSEIEGYWIADPGLPIPEEVVAAGQDYFASLNFTGPDTFDVEQWIVTMDENVVVNDAYGSEERVGHEAQRLFSQGLLGSGIQAIDFTIDFQIASGDRTAIKWTANANFGPGADLSWEGIDVFEVNGAGKITKVFGYWDESVFGN